MLVEIMRFLFSPLDIRGESFYLPLIHTLEFK